jgi:glycosyltransferase involved in cell wall biosynthesis
MKSMSTSRKPVSQPTALPSTDLSGLSVIIPAYNEAEGISATLAEVLGRPELAKSEIIVVDDASTDETASRIPKFPKVRLVQHTHNKGYSSSIASGIRAARGSHVCWFDADGQHRAEDLVAVTSSLIVHNWDYCIGVRTPQSYEEPSRRFGKWILRQAVRFVAGQSVCDFNSGLRGFRREVILRYLHLLPRGFGASTITTLLMLERGYFGGEVPIVVRKRVGKSTVRQVRDGFHTLLLLLRIFLLFKPLQFFGGLGALMVLIGGGYGLWKAFSLGQGFPILGALVVILGIQSFFFGLLADQVSALRRERFE